jgi:hypothetical protein
MAGSLDGRRVRNGRGRKDKKNPKGGMAARPSFAALRWVLGCLAAASQLRPSERAAALHCTAPFQLALPCHSCSCVLFSSQAPGRQ